MTNQPKTLSLKLPVPGFGKLCLGGDAQILGDNFTQYTLFIKLLGAEPECSGEQVKVFTFGFFVVKKESRVKAGFVKRRQILVRA